MTFPLDVPTLSDGEVVLRAHRPEDAAGVLEQCRDPLSRAWTTVPLDYDASMAEHFVTRTIPAGWEQGTERFFAVEATDGQERRYAGTMSLRELGSGRMEVAYGAHPWVRGRGKMERALRLMVDWGFEEHGAEMLVWWAHRGNWPSRRLAWRLGFTVEGSVRSWLPQRGALRDAWVATLLAGDPRQPTSRWLDVPVIEGRRLRFRPFTEADVPRIVEGCLDPETMRWLGQIPQPYDEEQARTFIEQCRENAAGGRAVVWALADPDTDLLIGTANLFDIRAGRDAETGYWVHPSARGRGVATEATRLMLRHAFADPDDGGLGLDRVHAVVAEGNVASRRVLEAAGLTEQGRRRRSLLVGEGRISDAITFDVLVTDDWRA